jgi:hypothetical protein
VLLLLRGAATMSAHVLPLSHACCVLRAVQDVCARGRWSTPPADVACNAAAQESSATCCCPSTHLTMGEMNRKSSWLRRPGRGLRDGRAPNPGTGAVVTTAPALPPSLLPGVAAAAGMADLSSASSCGWLPAALPNSRMIAAGASDATRDACTCGSRRLLLHPRCCSS